MKRRVFLGLPVILGILFYIWYIFHASDNVAYSDYIRLINSYLPDVTNPAKFFVPDILTRVPITYLGRIINVKLFGYNAYFDMILGVLSLGAGAAVLALYAERNRSVGYLSFLLIQFVYFSLNKWEMMTNGTGWVCTLSISGFLFHLQSSTMQRRPGAGICLTGCFWQFCRSCWSCWWQDRTAAAMR